MFDHATPDRSLLIHADDRDVPRETRAALRDRFRQSDDERAAARTPAPRPTATLVRS